MRSLDDARQQARTCRAALGASTDGLFERIVQYLLERHAIEPHPANARFLDGGRAEVSPAEGCLFYDVRLDDDPAEKLVTILHELGHLELHARLQRGCAPPDPVYGSMYLTDGASALARYNRRAREEAEANAFAAEFLCPSREVLQQWRQHPADDSMTIAQRLGVPLAIVQAQLAEALYWLTMGDGSAIQKSAQWRPFTYDASQHEAATFIGHPALVNAGPGTGKTATLVRRIEYLLEARGATPESFLVLTFSNDAAEELRDRIAERFGVELASRIAISTFHGFGVTFLHHHGQFLNIDAEATILDEVGQEDLVTRLLGAVRCDKMVALHDPEQTVKDIVRHINYLKDRLYDPERFAAELTAWQPSPEEHEAYAAARQFLDVYRAYEMAKADHQHIDFADCIACPIRIFDQNALLVERYREKYTWVLVDEYQDVSRAVAILLQKLCGPNNPPWVVGDAQQAIYRFRGAAPENVTQFDHDFPSARVFNLHTNYRSCTDIVQTANQLAAMMDTSADGDADVAERWRPGTDLTALGEVAVTIARAASDRAEQEGIAAQVAAWRAMGIPAHHIAVLARRNVDVRNIALALGRRGIGATTTGLVTPEGAAGDLAAMVTMPDHGRASLPRLAFALGRGRSPVEVINAVISRALATLQEEGTFAMSGYGEGQSLAEAMQRVVDALHARRFSADAFAMMCTFLFDASDYLRRLLDQPEHAERSLALGEVVTALAKAAGYRFTHPGAEPRASRLGFGQYFRASLNASSPSVAPPPAATEAVRVMTCHAAKGLEFPCVIVAGQTLAQSARMYTWLPVALQPSPEDDARQSDALLFVGATRAQQALMVTCAVSASGTERARRREVTPLLSRWHTQYDIRTEDWSSHAPASKRAGMGAVWGGAVNGALAIRALDKDACALRTYLEHYLHLRFPTHTRALYPIFFDAVRRTMGRIVRRAHEIGAQVSIDEAQGMLLQGWPQEEVGEHPHHALYHDLALTYVGRFARVYTPDHPAPQHADLLLQDAEMDLTLRLDLIAHYQIEDGHPVAVAWRPESMADKRRPDGVLWSSLSSAQRLSFVMLKRRDTELRPYVFSAEDGELYPYQWTRRARDVEKELERIDQQYQALDQQTFETQVKEWTCNRCPVRLVCPYWLGALGEESGA